MKYTAIAVIKFSIVASASIKNKINATATIKTLSPISQPCPTYNLIDGGQPQTTYVDINGFNLINGGQP
jgi:hypothetical protein